MMKVYKLLVATVISVVFATGTAIAFQGLSVGVIGNWATFDTVGQEIEGGYAAAADATTANEVNTGSISHDVEFGSFFVEYTTGGTLGATFGIEHVPGDATLGTRSRTDTGSTNETSDDTGTYTGKADISDYYAFYVEPTLMANDHFGFYLKGGASKITVTSLESISQGADDSAYGNEDVWGVMYGVGMKGVHSSGLFIKVEAIQTEYGTISLNSTTGNRNTIEAQPESTAGRIALGYNF